MSDKRRRREREAPREERIAPSVSDRALFPFFSAARFPSLHFFASCFLLSRCPVPQEPHSDSRSFEGTDHIAVLAPEAEPNARTSTTRRPSMVSAVGTLEPLKFSPLWRSLARCSSPSTLSASKEKRGGAPLTLVLARAGMLPVLKALSVLRTLSRPKATMLSERKRRRKGSRGGERSTASRVSFFLSFVQHEDFFFRPRFSTLFSNG